MSSPPEALIAALRDARHLMVLTGSGVSVNSGIPTFREAGTGLWARFRPEDLATPEAFARDPALVSAWYEWRRDLIKSANPNPAHFAIAELPALIPQVTLVTQNVDGLHQRAGSADVIEFHGNIHRDRCAEHGIQSAYADNENLPRRCPECAEALRPDVVWFGEAIPAAALSASLQAAATCDALIVAGTAGQVYPAAGLAETAKSNAACVIEVNTQASALSGLADYQLVGPAEEQLPNLVSALKAC